MAYLSNENSKGPLTTIVDVSGSSDKVHAAFQRLVNSKLYENGMPLALIGETIPGKDVKHELRLGCKKESGSRIRRPGLGRSLSRRRETEAANVFGTGHSWSPLPWLWRKAKIYPNSPSSLDASHASAETKWAILLYGHLLAP